MVDLVKHQMNISRRTVKSIFLVGGFGQSPLLRLYLQKHLPSDVHILAPVDGWTAVVRGALSKVVATVSSLAPPIAVESRVARKSYGIVEHVKFNPSIHEDGRK